MGSHRLQAARWPGCAPHPLPARQVDAPGQGWYTPRRGTTFRQAQGRAGQHGQGPEQRRAWVGELRYKPYGETRTSAGSIPTDYRYTGQRQEESLGLYLMGARWVDPYGQHPALQLCGPVKSPSALVQGARARRR